MNRSLTLLGAGLVVAAIAAFAYPVAVSGTETLNVPVEVGIVVLPAGLMVVLFGAASPDPRLTTIGGTFGNPEEDAVERAMRRRPKPTRVRYKLNPFESVNCAHCYTIIPPNVLECPRCGRERACRACRGTLQQESLWLRCQQCRRDEIYCSCAVTGGARGGRPGVRAT